MILFFLLLGAICAFGYGVVGQTQCAQPNPAKATCNCNGTVYDFSQIQGSAGGFFSGEATDGYNYYFEMVDNGLPKSFPGCTFDASQSVGNAAAQATTDGSSCYAIGSISQQVWTITPGSPQTINVVFSGGDDGRQTSVVVTCNPGTRGIYSPRGEVVSLIYELDIQSCAACPGANPCSGAPSPPSPPPPPPSPPGPPPPPPPTPPPPPPPTCEAIPTLLPWANFDGGVQGLGQTSIALSASLTLSNRVFVSQQSLGMAVGNNGIYAVTAQGVMVIQGWTPVKIINMNGTVASKIVLSYTQVSGSTTITEDVWAIVNTPDGHGALSRYSGYTGTVTTVPFPYLNNNSGGSLVADNVNGIVYVAVGSLSSVVPAADIYAFNANHDGITIGTPLTSVLWVDWLSLTPSLDTLVVFSSIRFQTTQIFALALPQGTTKWLVEWPALDSKQITHVTEKQVIFSNASGLFAIDIGLGTPTNITGGLPSHCISVPVIDDKCNVYCPVVVGGVTQVASMNMGTGVMNWVISLPGFTNISLQYNMIVDSAGHLAVSYSGASSAMLAIINTATGAVTWSTKIAGTASNTFAALAVDEQDSTGYLLALANGSPTYLNVFSTASSTEQT